MRLRNKKPKTRRWQSRKLPREGPIGSEESRGRGKQGRVLRKSQRRRRVHAGSPMMRATAKKPPRPKPNAGGVDAASTCASPMRGWQTSTRSASACAHCCSLWLRSAGSGGVGAGGVATGRQRRHPAQGRARTLARPARDLQRELNPSLCTASLRGTWRMRSWSKPPEKRTAAF